MKITDFNKEDQQKITLALQEFSAAAKFEQTLERLFNGWCQLAISVEEGYKLSIFDYTNDLSERFLLQEIKIQLTKGGQDLFDLSLRPHDEHFKSVTKKTRKPIHGEYDESFWWYYRVPKVMPPDFEASVKFYEDLLI
ncbi:MAG: hypothetical protein DWQ07_12060 [Chloroflexi bacterium]|nr:MAG: hypothetical protein DWQ07_12060 [Chloroflexota bacterium]MBL1196093.1 hypothetical protein [Chloroflexota bacterium]NOH13386.1 hypothetical protein [Chloroflexota bacterium]